MDGWMDEQMDGWMDGWMTIKIEYIKWTQMDLLMSNDIHILFT